MTIASLVVQVMNGETDAIWPLRDVLVERGDARLLEFDLAVGRFFRRVRTIVMARLNWNEQRKITECNLFDGETWSFTAFGYWSQRDRIVEAFRQQLHELFWLELFDKMGGRLAYARSLLADF